MKWLGPTPRPVMLPQNYSGKELIEFPRKAADTAERP